MTAPTSGATAHEIEKRVSKEVLEAVATLTDDGEGVVTTAAVVEHVFGDAEENARHGDPIGAMLDDLDAHGYVRREAREDGDDVWTDAQPAAFHRDYVTDLDAAWPPGRGETP